MASHRYHPRTGDDTDTILFDDCPGCERHTNLLGLTLDSDAWAAMWERMLSVEFPGTDGEYMSENESKLGAQMYRVYVALERYTKIDPHHLPWKG